MSPSSICARWLVLVSGIALAGCGPARTASPTAAPAPTPTTTAAIAFPTQAPTASPTLPSNPVVSPTDALASGPFLFQATFASDEGWLVGTDADGGVGLSEDSLTIAVSRPSGSRYVLVPALLASDFLLEATVHSSLCAEEDEVGLLFRVGPQADHYRVTLSCSGMARVTRVLGASAALLAGPTAASSAIPGSPSVNRLAVLARGSEFAFFVNGIEVLRSRDTRLVSGGFGFFVRSSSQGQTTAALTSLTVRALEAGALPTPTPVAG